MKQLKLQIVGGKATPAPPLGPVLGQTGINIGEFVNQFNAATREQMGEMTSVAMTIYDDRTFEFAIKTPPMSAMLKKAAGITSGSGTNAKKKEIITLERCLGKVPVIVINAEVRCTGVKFVIVGVVHVVKNMEVVCVAKLIICIRKKQKKNIKK